METVMRILIKNKATGRVERILNLDSLDKEGLPPARLTKKWDPAIWKIEVDPRTSGHEVVTQGHNNPGV
jgi:hypothetical protein